ncbi:MAG: HDOD domain-containing protein [Chthoniobacterales bacterium]|nr:HDOD domain-containing protein [Chthoniobacterales bacterium]
MKTKEEFADAIKRIENLHGNMAVLSRLHQIFKDPNSELSQGERLVRSDANLSAQIIKLANSPIYRRGNFSPDLSSAIQKVGFNELLRMVSIALSKGVFLRDLKAYGISARQYWETSYFCALYLETTYFLTNTPKSEAYLIGLLHQIGKVIIEELLREARIEIYWDSYIPCEQWEEVMVGFRYDFAGATILERWKFPDTITGPIGQQTNPEARAKSNLLTTLDYCSNLLSKNNHSNSVEDWNLLPDHPYWEMLKASREETLQFLRTSNLELGKTKSLLAHI